MAETQQVCANYSNEEEGEESPEPETSRSRRRRFKAANMSFGEMLEMVDILKKADYDGKYGPYPNPNVRNAEIMAIVVKSLHRNFRIRRSKDQLRKRWSDLKLREQEQYRKIRRVLQKREKRLGGHLSSEETTDPPPLEEGEIHPSQAEQKDADVVEIGTTTGDCDVVDPGHFTSESAQILIGEIIGCNRD
ncbi:uncharacterized protein [Aquarana catesbeiana]|uniref:uncharacterized protein isoform X2 n=1 Tax=Aquarana catesbeiana TaxID=8400 RepID=UPI003CCA1D34